MGGGFPGLALLSLTAGGYCTEGCVWTSCRGAQYHPGVHPSWRGVGYCLLWHGRPLGSIMTSDLFFQSHSDGRGSSPHSLGTTRTQEWERSPSLFLHSTLHHSLQLSCSIYRSLLPTELFGREAENVYVYVNIPSRLPATCWLSSGLVTHYWVCRVNQLSKELAGILDASLSLLQAPPISMKGSLEAPLSDFNLSKERANLLPFH